MFLEYRSQSPPWKAMNVEEADLVDTIELASQVRESVSQIINIENPTDVEVTI